MSKKIVNLQNFKDRIDAESYRSLQATAVLAGFERKHGRSPADDQELADWVKGSKFKVPIDPSEFLTDEEIRKALTTGKKRP